MAPVGVNLHFFQWDIVWKDDKEAGVGPYLKSISQNIFYQAVTTPLDESQIILGKIFWVKFSRTCHFADKAVYEEPLK